MCPYTRSKKDSWCRSLAGLGAMLVLNLTPIALPIETVWTRRSDMPTSRWNFAACTLDDKIYVMGGEPSENSGLPGHIATLEVYDPATDSWASKTDLPTARVAPSACAVGGKIYAIGGLGGGVRALVHAYDPAMDSWTRRTEMPTPRWLLATCVWDEKIYAIGGSSSPNLSSGLRTVEQYDPLTDTWTSKADMPVGVWGLCAHALNGKIYALGGRPIWDAVPVVQEYDPATDSWSLKRDMPVATSQVASVVVDDRIFLFGGWFISRINPLDTFQVYEPSTEIWTTGVMPFPRVAFEAGVVGNRIYTIGGTFKAHPCPALATVDEVGVSFPPDFNRDFEIDIEDLLTLIEHWGSSEPSVDIAPQFDPDGMVDAQDLEALMEYWGHDLFDRSLVVHWKLDEQEGDIALDSAGDHDGSVLGGAIWQPEGGQIGGALQLDGIDDCIETPSVWNPSDGTHSSVLDPTEGSFSVFAWVKGGGPGQVITSQAGDRNWLMASPRDAYLKTEIKGTIRGAGPLISEGIVTDGDWHRVGLVWDGTYRNLYIDDELVATDTVSQGALRSSGEVLRIGAGANLEAGSFFSGLIDDVRIYNRAVRP